MKNLSFDNNMDFVLSEAALRGRQSVRTTFRLPEYLIELLGVAASQFGVKQKSLFDQLVEMSADSDGLQELAGVIPSSTHRRAKTFVISRNSLVALEKVADERSVPRDFVAELAITRLLPVLLAERERHAGRAEILRKMAKFCQQGQELLEDSEQRLGKNDPATEALASMLPAVLEALANIEQLVEKGRALEKFVIEQVEEQNRGKDGDESA